MIKVRRMVLLPVARQLWESKIEFDLLLRPQDDISFAINKRGFTNVAED